MELAKVALGHLREAMLDGLVSFLVHTGKRRDAHTKNSYFRGVADGFIWESTHAQHAELKRHRKEEANRYALVLLDKEKRISEFVKTTIKPKATASRSRARHDAEAYDHGYQRGSAIDFTTKLERRAA